MKYSDLSAETRQIFEDVGASDFDTTIKFIAKNQPDEKAFLKQLDYWLCFTIVNAQELREKIRGRF